MDDDYTSDLRHLGTEKAGEFRDEVQDFISRIKIICPDTNGRIVVRGVVYYMTVDGIETRVRTTLKTEPHP